LTKLGDDRDQAATDNRPTPDSDRIPGFSETLALHPLMAHPAAVMAAATAIGISFTTQFAGAFFGALQGAMEASNRHNAVSDATEGEGAPARQEAKAEPASTKAPEMKAGQAEAEPVRKAPASRTPKERSTKAKAVMAVRETAPAGDLKIISGIGPKLEKVLHGMGVTSVAQIAGWTKTDIARFDKRLGFSGRIGRDDWVGQAKALMR